MLHAFIFGPIADHRRLLGPARRRHRIGRSGRDPAGRLRRHPGCPGRRRRAPPAAGQRRDLAGGPVPRPGRRRSSTTTTRTSRRATSASGPSTIGSRRIRSAGSSNGSATSGRCSSTAARATSPTTVPYAEVALALPSIREAIDASFEPPPGAGRRLERQAGSLAGRPAPADRPRPVDHHPVDPRGSRRRVRLGRPVADGRRDRTPRGPRPAPGRASPDP